MLFGECATAKFCAAVSPPSEKPMRDPITSIQFSAYSRASGNPGEGANSWVPAFAGTSGVSEPIQFNRILLLP